MKKIFLKSITMLGISIIFLMMMTSASEATLSISAQSTVEPGKTFNVTVSVGSDEAGAVTLSISGGTLSQTSIDLMTQSSVIVSCTAGSSGTITISGSGLVANYSTETEGTQSASKTITIKQPEPTTPTTQPSGGNTTKPSNNTTTSKSSNSRLSSLAIEGVVLTPEFSAGTKEYTVNVPNEITTLAITANPEHSKATVRIEGNEELELGENEIKVIVTAEDGSRTTYEITAIRADVELGLQSLLIAYEENGTRKEYSLEPAFMSNVYEYKLKTNIPYNIEKLIIEGIATKENATVTITGNENLKEGLNEIKIVVLLKDEETEVEEQKTYIIKVTKDTAPIETATTNDKNWLEDAKKWLRVNTYNIVTVAMVIVTVTQIGLTIYFGYDYKQQRRTQEELAELQEELAGINRSNLRAKANRALEPENIPDTDEEDEESDKKDADESVEEDEEISDATKILRAKLDEMSEIDDDKPKRRSKPSRGKRFK